MNKAKQIKGMRGYNNFIDRIQAVIPETGSRLTLISETTKTFDAALSSNTQENNEKIYFTSL